LPSSFLPPDSDPDSAVAIPPPTHEPPNTCDSSVLATLGWRGAPPADTGLVGRVISQDRAGWTVASLHGELLCKLKGRLRASVDALAVPAVGDWVAIEPRPDERRATIEAVLPRSTALVRKAAGRTSNAQVVAANVDVVFITVPGDAAPKPRRVERELVTVWESGATPVIVATKSDLAADISWIDDVSMGTPTVPVDAFAPDTLTSLDPWLGTGTTVVLLGPSGAGKSTLANGLLGRTHLDTGEVRATDRRGRHTTTRRELVRLPGGALLIDTPGIRELSLWDAGDAVAAAFSDVEDVAAGCRFRDCTHLGEPGCAVVGALADGTLDESRVRSWDKLQREAAHQARRSDHRLATEERRKWAQRSKDAKRRSRP
jgi:ribosome biogenesis GTPase / thiamine phosphate phosphatase